MIERQKCTAKAKSTGNRCGNNAIPGGTVCSVHGGRARQVVAAAQRRLAQAEAQHAVESFGLPLDIDPADALLEEVRRSAGLVRFYEVRVRALDEDAFTFGVAEQRVTGTGEDAEKTVTTKAATNAWLNLYNAERKHLVEVCAAALRAGVEERQVRIAERAGDLVADAIEAILAALELTPEQQERVPDIVPAQLRLLAGGAA